MNQSILEELAAAWREGRQCILATIAATRGSVPRQTGTKMIVYPGGAISGTIGGGKFEALIVADCLTALDTGAAVLKSYVLREDEPGSFGAICGGEVTVLIEPQGLTPALYLIGAGHCAQALARLAGICGFRVTIVEDRAELVEGIEWANSKITGVPAAEFVASRDWSLSDAIVLVSRNYQLDRDALEAALTKTGFGYIGMIGSRRKVLRVYDELKKRGIDPTAFEQVHAPIGLDIGADSPEEIAVSILAEILATLRHRSGRSLKEAKG
jgi:xanthine dehydrogenase accessory factor